ncbi:MAG: OprO/OprP family phosphate-selective porin [Prevotella sp.]|jgi:hypothetical protein|nr:OprO/OprP family phosphate-selective porin [Prevotella sp.]MCH4212631.1 OprO/OprP family phosphate-selective porin [Prevotella sp.]MCH4241731.1 OprO/OprP family phosphate-selective porin [Prevotella sp.]MCI1742619.1 OprO/OprP family phosphate-selective porin [Prevotella sp.]MCI1742681.1 OprO/OprP family phosphate-selective porin [Prevotella sp.]
MTNLKRGLFLTFTAAIVCTANAQTKLPGWINSIKLSGYGMTQYQYSGKDGAKANSFNLRLGRIMLDGRIKNDFFWRIQLQVNGNTSTLGSSPRLVDLYTEWQKYDFLRVKIGQFKRPFTFENPMNPIDQGFMSYGQAVEKLAGFSDRNGEHSSNGRDIGLQMQGDFLKNAKGRNLLHYQVGVFNGQGINVKDVDQQKDLIGGIWVMPVPGMRLGTFGWTGSYARKGTWTIDGVSHNGVRSLQQHRYAFSAEYLFSDWTLRSEFVHSTGQAFAKALSNTNDNTSNDCTISDNGSQAQGVYALVIAPIIQKRLHAKARYDMYQPTGDTSKMRTQYEVGLDYEFDHNFEINGEYAFVNDRSLKKNNYSIVDVEVDFRF